MNVLILEFTDDMTREEACDQVPVRGRLRLPRLYYLALLEEARKVHMEWIFRDGVDFICENCKSFTIPAKGLYLALRKIRDTSRDPDFDDPVRPHLTHTFPLTADLWRAYGEGKLRHIPFIYDERGELLWEHEDGPEMLACDEVVFKFRPSCVCDGIYKRMYENIN